MRGGRRWAVGLALIAAAFGARAAAVDVDAAWRASQAAIGHQVGDHALLDREGRPRRLSGLRGQPLLVSFVYTGCFQVCPASTRELHAAVLALQARLGTGRFRVASIGFNPPADSPQAMKAFAAQQRVDATPDWEFYAVHPKALDALAADFGFAFGATPAGFDHLLQVSVLDGDGRVVQQVVGDRPSAAQLAETLQGLFDGRPPPPATVWQRAVERVRILCTVYDPETGTYRVDRRLAIEIAGGLTFIVGVLGYLFNEWLQRRRRRALRAA